MHMLMSSAACALVQAIAARWRERALLLMIFMQGMRFAHVCIDCCTGGSLAWICGVAYADLQQLMTLPVLAGQAAVEEGIVIGGGCTFLKLAQKVDDIKATLDNDEQKAGSLLAAPETDSLGSVHHRLSSAPACMPARSNACSPLLCTVWCAGAGCRASSDSCLLTACSFG